MPPQTNTNKTTVFTYFRAGITMMRLRTGLATVVALLASGAAWAQTPAPAGDAAAGAKKNAMCIGCHGIEGYKTAFPEVYSARIRA
jgi:cytochrome c553